MNLREFIIKNSGIICEDDENIEKKEVESSSDILADLKKLANGELVASVQYKIAELVAKGEKNLSYLQGHFKEHSEEEMGHYEKVVNAILERGGSVELNLKTVDSDALPVTEELSSTSTDALRDFFFKAEDEAIKAYEAYLKKIEGKDASLEDIITGIIEDERGHRYDFQKIKENE